MLEVDIERLREVAGKLRSSDDEIDAIAIRSAATPRLPGTEVEQICAELFERVEGAYLRIADRLRGVGVSDRTSRSSTRPRTREWTPMPRPPKRWICTTTR